MKDKEIYDILEGLQREPLMFDLGDGRRFLCYDQVVGADDLYVGYMRTMGVPLDVVPYTINLRDLSNYRSVGSTAGHNYFKLRFGRRVSLAELVWMALNCEGSTAARSLEVRCEHVVNGAYRAGLLPRYDLMGMLAAVPSVWFSAASSYGGFMTRLLAVDPLHTDKLLGLAEEVVTDAARMQRHMQQA